MGKREKSNSLSTTKKKRTADSERKEVDFCEWLDLTLGSIVRS